VYHCDPGKGGLKKESKERGQENPIHPKRGTGKATSVRTQREVEPIAEGRKKVQKVVTSTLGSKNGRMNANSRKNG